MTSFVDPPTAIADGEWIPSTAIPSALRKFGFFPNLASWNPGDVVLTRSPSPDLVSKKIKSIQELGYGKEAASWTHAAVYLGDGLMLCEAQFDPPDVSRVIVAHVWSYVGTHELLVKRSLHASSKERGWAIATAAASRLGDAYDFGFIVRLAAKRVFLGDAIWQEDQSGMTSSKALVCSSLYSTSHAYVTDVSITDKTNGVCVPAHLAALGAPHLQPVQFNWLRIRN